jgi:hypothetical protein
LANATHRAQIRLPFLRVEWRAGQLPIGQLDVEFFDRLIHHRQIVIANLVTKAAENIPQAARAKSALKSDA